MHEVLVNRLGGLSLPRKSVVRLTDRPDMTLDVYRGRKTTMQQQQPLRHYFSRYGKREIMGGGSRNNPHPHLLQAQCALQLSKTVGRRDTESYQACTVA